MGIYDRDWYREAIKEKEQQSNKRFIKRPQPAVTPNKKTAPVSRFVKRSSAILFVLLSSVSVAVITFFVTLYIAMKNPRLLTPAIELIKNSLLN